MIFLMTVPFVVGNNEVLANRLRAKGRVEVARKILQPLDPKAVELCTTAYLPADVVGSKAEETDPETMGVPNFGFFRRMTKGEIKTTLQRIADAVHIPVYINNDDPEELIACFPRPQ